MPLVMALMLAQAAACGGDAARHLEVAAARAEVFDVRGAGEAYAAAVREGCADAEVGAHYLLGLAAAREAYADGGSSASLDPVTQAVAALDARAGRLPGRAQIASLVLQAAAAAAQSERDQMGLLLEHAVHLESIQLEAGERPLPLVSAHEVAGDLWLQVHRFDDARGAYEQAVARVGRTPRVLLGLARVAARVADVAACGLYRELLTWWAARADDRVEIIEARAYVSTTPCQP